MYKIIAVPLEGGSVDYIVYNIIKKKEVARYSTYEEAYQDVIGR